MSKIRYYSLYAKAIDSNGQKHMVTVVGKLETEKFNVSVAENMSLLRENGKVDNGAFVFDKNVKKKKLTLGLAICHPDDDFDQDVGEAIAKRRINNGEDIGSIESYSPSMLTKDAIMAEIIVKLTWITENIDKYIS